ncbi:MAG TPA: hypothetical protein ENK70_00310 [Methylophaga sp.]|nr:hypothetical protein [Methylophaga sp.]
MRHILVLGVHTEERDHFGGIVDDDSLTNSDDDRDLLKAINVALADAKDNPGIISGSATLDYGNGNSTVYETMPFTGTIEAEVCLFLD